MCRSPAGSWTCSMLLLAGLMPGQEANKQLTLRFGVYTSDKPTTMYRQFTPILERLQDRMEQKLGQPVSISLKIDPSYDESLDSFVAGKSDFVRFGPASYVLARKRNPKIELLAVELVKGKRTFLGMIVVRKESRIRKLSDLRGARFAFGDENSTIGRYLVQDLLLDAGLGAADLKSHQYLGRHDKVFRAVEIGDFDAGALKSGTFHKLNRQDNLRVLVQFHNVTKPWIARSGLDPRVTGTLRSALLSMTADSKDDSEALQALKVSGFGEGSDDEFDSVRRSMCRAERFTAPAAKPGR